jgi:uncharacterized protein (TIGR02757 family)
MMPVHIKLFFVWNVKDYNQPAFIKDDPISIPHLFTKIQDIEIACFFAAVFAWGNRTTIINKSRELMQMMDEAPHEFCLNHTEADLKRLFAFKHRTFNTTDLLYFIEFFKYHYAAHQSLETAFTQNIRKADFTIERSLINFHSYFFSLPDVPNRTRKHISTPLRKAACKRLNMYLRWMVRKDKHGVDFGLWKIDPAHLIIPLDLHVARVARHLKLLERKPTDWQAALELTSVFKQIDPADPAKYDFALFGLGVLEKF